MTRALTVAGLIAFCGITQGAAQTAFVKPPDSVRHKTGPAGAKVV